MSEIKVSFREDDFELPIGMSNVQKDWYISKAMEATDKAEASVGKINETLDEQKAEFDQFMSGTEDRIQAAVDSAEGMVNRMVNATESAEEAAARANELFKGTGLTVVDGKLCCEVIRENGT